MKQQTKEGGGTRRRGPSMPPPRQRDPLPNEQPTQGRPREAIIWPWLNGITSKGDRRPNRS